MKVIAHIVNKEGFVIDSEVVNPSKDVIPENRVITNPPLGVSFYKMRWTGSKWTEGATPDEIAELMKPIPHVPTNTEILGQQTTEREIESMIQGQQITDIDLRLMIIEMGAN
ncbi:hypothetical protein [Sporosarcina sp. E16_8]|uniref:hypothetical protein n=1 Tax=Sporosarcina sp. E16_8 TaxID=2789295 RepID=UPI001A90FCA1|nr:hypothetical protein [Sporosarcina sp. E16_8]MBO0586112.1 hypothetical protein [Sporosarcina sp. E16_8]